MAICHQTFWVSLFHHLGPFYKAGCNIHQDVFRYPPERKCNQKDTGMLTLVNFPWLSGDVPRLPSYGINISQLVRFSRCCTSVFDFHSKNLQITSKLLTPGYRYHKLWKTFGNFFCSELLSKFGAISFQEYVSEGITHPVFYIDLVYKLRRVKGEANFILSGSKIVKSLRRRRRQYDPAIIERTIGLVLDPFTALYMYRSFLMRCTLTNKAVGTIWRV